MQTLTPKLKSWASIAEPNTIEQARIASEMPFVGPHIALMPDCHLGMGATVGSVIPTQGAIIPAAVGVDIGCGMQAVRTEFTKATVADDLHYLRELITDYIPMGIGKPGENTELTHSAAKRIAELEAAHPYGDTALANWRMQLGSLGSGNHFIELDLDAEGFVWVTLHSGSRGVGNKTAVSYIDTAKKLAKRWHVPLADPDLAFFPEGEQYYTGYIAEVKWLQAYARANRDEMVDRVLRAMAQWVGSDEGTIAVQERFDVHHNYIAMEHHMGRDLWITRKGAIRARQGDVALIPGSMGTPSYVVEGKGNVPSFTSAPHGAGRAMGRRQAFRTITMEDARKAMEGVVWGDHEKLIDETPDAYKDIVQVMADAADLVTVKHVLRPILNIKGS